VPGRGGRELELVIPLWGSVLVALVGMVYLVFGSRWPRLFDVLSMTVLGCTAGLQASEWVPVWQPLVIIAGGIALGSLTAFFRTVAHAVLAGLVLAAIFAHLAALALGPGGFASYLVFAVPDRSYSMQMSGPNLGEDAVLAACLVGLALGAGVAVTRFGFSERLVTSAQGAALLVLAAIHIAGLYRETAPPSLTQTFPLTLAAGWVCLVGIGLAAQRAVAGAAGEEEPPIEPRPRGRRRPEG